VSSGHVDNRASVRLDGGVDERAQLVEPGE
jgi:hypothetical protein